MRLINYFVHDVMRRIFPLLFIHKLISILIGAPCGTLQPFMDGTKDHICALLHCINATT